MSEATVEETNLEELVKIYLTIRNERERIEAEWKAVDKELLVDLQALESQMLVACNENNASSIKTASGTVMRRLSERYTVANGEAFRRFVMENEVPELFEQRIAQTNFKEFIAERKDDGLPPGVNVMREFTIVVRKPSN
jgi:hypothetical protein